MDEPLDVADWYRIEMRTYPSVGARRNWTPWTLLAIVRDAKAAKGLADGYAGKTRYNETVETRVSRWTWGIVSEQALAAQVEEDARG